MALNSESLSEIWGDREKDGDWMLRRWAQWAKAGKDVQGYATLFHNKEFMQALMSDDFGIEIDTAITRCSVESRAVLKSAYLEKKLTGFSDLTILTSIREFMHVYENS